MGDRADLRSRIKELDKIPLPLLGIEGWLQGHPDDRLVMILTDNGKGSKFKTYFRYYCRNNPWSSSLNKAHAVPCGACGPLIQRGTQKYRILKFVLSFLGWVPFCGQKAVFWNPVTKSRNNLANNYTGPHYRGGPKLSKCGETPAGYLGHWFGFTVRKISQWM
jgi:hypothetical protein